MKTILTTPETAEVYLENFKQLASAIMNSGGEPFRILKQYDDFLRTLSNNNISVTAKYDGPEFKKQEDHTKEEYNAVSYEQKVADAIDEECRMTEEDYDEIDWNKWMEENSEEKTKSKDFEIYPPESSSKDCSMYFLEIYNNENWKLCLRNDFSVPKFGWSGHSYTLGEGKIAADNLIDMYTLRNLKRIVDGLNLLYAKDHAPFPHTTFETSKEKVDWNKPVSTGDPIVTPTIPYTTSNPMPNTTSSKRSDEWTPMFNNTPWKHSSFPK